MVLEYISFGSLKHLNSCLLGIFDPVICFTIFLSLEKLKHLMCVFLAETTFCLPNFTSFSPARSWRHVSIWTVCVWLVLCNLKEHFLANNDLATNGSAVRGGSPGSATILAYFLPMKIAEPVFMCCWKARSRELGLRGCGAVASSALYRMHLTALRSAAGLGHGENRRREWGSCLCCSAGALPAGGNAPGSQALLSGCSR